MFTKVRSYWDTLENKYPDASIIELCGLGWKAFWRRAWAKWYLRKCTKIGHLVSTRKKPMVDNQGQIILHDEVRVWSNIVQAKLLSGKNGTLEIGSNTRINGAHIDAQCGIKIGNNCRVGPYSLIMDSNFHDTYDHFSDISGEPIVIEDNVWITSKVTVLKGVKIGTGAVVATGAVVTKNVAPFTLVGGVPAKLIKNLKND